MRLRRVRPLPAAAVRAARVAAPAGVLALALGGCGEIKNTITPTPGTANSLTVLLPTGPSADYVGIYEAQTQGYFRQADLVVRLQSPATGVADTLQPLWGGDAQIGVSDEPSVLLARNSGEALVAVAAIAQGPLSTVEATHVEAHRRSSQRHGRHGRHSTSTKAKTKLRRVGDDSLLPTSLRHRSSLPTYNGLTIVVRKATIVNQAPVIRRFVQAVARGYEALRGRPKAALQALLTVDPALARTRALQLAQVENALPSFFPSGSRPWGRQDATEWNAFGTWLTRQSLIENPNATPDASTNELLAGQGV